MKIEEYIFTVLATSNANTELDKVETAFEVCGTKSLSCIGKVELRKALKMSLNVPVEESDKIFEHAKIDFPDTTVNFEFVLAALSERAEYTHIFAVTTETRKKSI